MNDWLMTLAPCPSSSPPGFAARSLCGENTHEVGWVEPRRVIYDHELILIQSGCFDITLEDTVYECPAHSYLIIPPGCWHSTVCRRQGHRHYLHFDWRYEQVSENAPVMTFFPAPPVTACFRRPPKEIPAGIPHGRIRAPALIYSQMERLRLMLASSNPHEQRASRGVLLELLIRLLDTRSDGAATNNRKEELAHRVRETLDQTITDPHSDVGVCALLARMGYSYEHLARVFRGQYGLSPVGYLHSIRIERAKHLLWQTELTVAAVADKVGYSDSVYFTRLFKRHTGISPARFRQA